MMFRVGGILGNRSPKGGEVLVTNNMRKPASGVVSNSGRAMRVAACVVIGVLMLGMLVTAQTGGDRSAKITIIADGKERQYTTGQRTVAEVLTEAGVALGENDRCYPATSARIQPGTRIRVTRVVYATVVQSEPIKFRTVVRITPGITGRMVLHEGQQGERGTKYLVITKDGVQTEKTLKDSWIAQQPVNEVVAYGKVTEMASRDGMGIRGIRMVATGYDPHPRGGGCGRTACGLRAGRGVVAVDPRVIRLGTKLYVEGYGMCVAGDTGGAIKGNRIDLGFAARSEACRYGRRVVTVYILN